MKGLREREMPAIFMALNDGMPLTHGAVRAVFRGGGAKGAEEYAPGDA